MPFIDNEDLPDAAQVARVLAVMFNGLLGGGTECIAVTITGGPWLNMTGAELVNNTSIRVYANNTRLEAADRFNHAKNIISKIYANRNAMDALVTPHNYQQNVSDANQLNLTQGERDWLANIVQQINQRCILLNNLRALSVRAAGYAPRSMTDVLLRDWVAAAQLRASPVGETVHAEIQAISQLIIQNPQGERAIGVHKPFCRCCMVNVASLMAIGDAVDNQDVPQFTMHRSYTGISPMEYIVPENTGVILGENLVLDGDGQGVSQSLLAHGAEAPGAYLVWDPFSGQ